MAALVCTDLYPVTPIRSRGGVTTAVRELVEGAIRHGADISQVVRFLPLLSSSGFVRPKARQAGPLEVLDAPRIGTRFRYSRRLTQLALRRAGRLRPTDVVVCHTTASFAMARRVLDFPGARFVLVVHACDLGHRDLAFALERADAVYCRSEALRGQLLARHGFAAHGVIGSGIAPEDFSSPAKPADGPLRLVVAATLIPRRRIGAVLDALALLDGRAPFRLDLFGDGPLLPEIRAAAQRPELAVRVVLHGFRPRAEVLAAMRDAHLFLMPSEGETLGLSYLEAMAQGCVVVGHRGWGIDGIVEDGRNGYLVDAARPELIAGKVLAYLDSDRGAMHERAFATARLHTSDAAAANYARMIATMMASGPA